MSLKKAAQGVIKPGGEITEGALNLVEMAFRAYDPCLSCATHALGKMPLEVTLLNVEGTVVDRRRQGVGHRIPDDGAQLRAGTDAGDRSHVHLACVSLRGFR